MKTFRLLVFANSSAMSVRIIFLSCVAVLFALSACDIEFGPTPRPPEGDWQLLVTTDEASSRLVVLSQPDNNVVNANLFLNADSLRGIGGRVAKIKTFREYIYVFLPEQQRITVLSSTNYRLVKILDFAAQNRTPADIVFVNATRAYVAFSNTTMLGVLDLDNLTFGRDIQVGRNPVALELRHVEQLNINEVYCALAGDNQIAVITSNGANDMVVTARIPVSSPPRYIGISPNKSELLVVSNGSGTPRTAPRVTLINLTDRRVTREASLFIEPADSSSENVYGLAISDREFAYIPMNKSLVRLDVRNLTRAIALEGIYRTVSYNPIRAEIVTAADSTTTPAACTILSTTNDSVKTVLSLERIGARVRHVTSR